MIVWTENATVDLKQLKKKEVFISQTIHFNIPVVMDKERT